jgi:hypothetical protein
MGPPIRSPIPAHAAQHNHSPAPRLSLNHVLPIPGHNPKQHVAPGRAWDHLRERTPNAITKPFQEDGRRWREFVHPQARDATLEVDFDGENANGEWDEKAEGKKAEILPLDSKHLHEFSPRLPQHESHFGPEERIVSWEELDKMTPGLELPWRMEHVNPDDEIKGLWLFTPAKRRRTHQRWRAIIMHSPFVPLVIRLTVLTFSVLALALASSIFKGISKYNQHASEAKDCDQGSSTYMAIIVDCVAIIYTFMITTDEFRSKPIGLRSASSKVRLIFLDIFFIVFDSANLSLAFHALGDESWVCTQTKAEGCVYDRKICDKQKALTATLLIALIAWLVTFGVSIFRVIERITDRRED